MRIAIAGDYFVERSQCVPVISESLIDLFKDCKAVLLNFEGPIAEKPFFRRAFKTGPNIRQNPNSLSYLKNCGVTAIGLANNHCFDFGESGVSETLSLATDAALGIYGLVRDGENHPYVVSEDSINVSVLGYAEEEWCGSGNLEPKIALDDLVDICRDIKRCALVSDAVVVVLHGNAEYCKVPSPMLQKRARFIIESGASAVVIHHSHVIAGIETWCSRPIFYGLGNFQFTMKSPSLDWYEGLVALLDFSRDEFGNVKVKADYVPVVRDADTHAVDMASGCLRNHIVNEVCGLSLCLSSSSSIDAQFKEYCKSVENSYFQMLNPFYGQSRLFRVVGYLFVSFYFMRRNRQAMLLNTLRCSSHRETLRCLLTESIDYEIKS
jgi:poly-gamma-glutamate synthesis protein (capsule biosynthesis protein)